MRGNLIEHIKNCVMMMLFICMVILAGSFIMQTQRLTLSQPIDISRDSLLVLKTGDNINVKYDQELLYPEFIGYKTKNITSRGYIENDIIYDIYPHITEYISYMLGSDANCIKINNDADAYWNQCLRNDTYVYIKYHTEIPNVMLYAYLTDDYLIDNTKVALGDMLNIKEIIFLLEFDETYNYEYIMVARDTNGNTARFEMMTDDIEELYFDINIFNTYDANNVFVYYDFAAYTETEYTNITLDDSTIMYTSEMTIRGINLDTSIKDELKNAVVELLNYNPAVSYKEDNGRTSVYVDTHGRLRIDSDGNINYKFTESDTIQDNRINIYDYLNYSKNNSDYSVYETILAVNNFMEMIPIEDQIIFGNIHTDGANITIEYYYCYNNIIILDSEYKPVIAYKFVISDNCFKEININIVNITQANKKANLKTNFVLQLYDLTLEQKIYTFVDLVYIMDDSASVCTPEYILRVK